MPEDFIELMRSHLGDEQAGVLFRGLQEPPTVAVRFNRRKLNFLKDTRGLTLSSSLCDVVPWCPDAYYLDERKAFTFDPLFHAGVYYVQDASSMYLAEVFRKYAGHPSVVLDLCAAPGGKSTLISSLLPAGSLFVSNEPIRKRTQILAENMQKWCTPPFVGSLSSVPDHVLVTQNFPEHFSHLHEAFDLILTDVPCSGEGMFRKDEQAVSEWSLTNVRQCVERQRDILRSILPTLKPGGILVYSTCTFNRFEDEEQVQWLVDAHRMDLLEERHFFPGQDRGEGLYMAVLRSSGTMQESGGADLAALQKKLSRTLNVVADIAESNRQWDTVDTQLDLSYPEAIAYLRREALHIAAPRGIVAVTYCGIPLGLAKSVGNRLNNLYPQEWRIRTTYSPTDPLPDFFHFAD